VITSVAYSCVHYSHRLLISEFELSLNNSQFIALAWIEGRLTGAGTALSDLVTNTYLTFLAVVPSYRNMCIGHKLPRRIQDDSRGTGLFGTTANTKARRFYEKAGMTAVDPDFVMPMSKMNK
jgi:GNAT superfamily N-acetyltransferase